MPSLLETFPVETMSVTAIAPELWESRGFLECLRTII